MVIIATGKGKMLYKAGESMDKILRQSLLYDFYGELLTEHQKNIYEDIILNDLSYSEVAREEGISRQGVYDLVKRCDKILEEYEEKLHLVEKFQNAKRMVSDIKSLTKEVLDNKQEDIKRQSLEKIIEISNEILEEY